MFNSFATLWTVACQASLSTGLSRQEYWSMLPFPTLGYLPKPGIEPEYLASPSLQMGSFFSFFFFCSLLKFFKYFLGQATQHVGSLLPDKGLNPLPLNWKHRVLITGPPGNPKFIVFKILSSGLSTKMKQTGLFWLKLLKPVVLWVIE